MLIHILSGNYHTAKTFLAEIVTPLKYIHIVKIVTPLKFFAKVVTSLKTVNVEDSG
jgi:hypothetical protein